MNLRRPLKWLLPLLVLSLGAGSFLYLKASRPERPKPKPKEKVWQVAVFEAQPRTLSPSLTLYGETETPDLLQAASPGAGVVTEVRVRKGQRVREGDRLLALDPRDFQLAVDQAQAEVLDLEAQLKDLDLRHQADQAELAQEQRLLELAQAEVTRQQRLKKQGLGAETALDKAREALGGQQLKLISQRDQVDRYPASRRQLEARLQRNRARLEQARLALQRSQVVAPFDGLVASVPVAVGDRVQTGQILLSLYAPQRLEVRARIPARYQAEIQAALNAHDQLTARAEMAGEPVQLTLDRLAGEADPSGIDGLFRVTRGSEHLRMGNLLKLHLQRPPQPNLVAIPFQAIYGNDRIYLLKDGRMQGLDVEAVGQSYPEGGSAALLIRNPEITLGDQIIRTHLPNAVSGLRVKVVGS